MGLATGIRIVQGILGGSINGAALQTLLGTSTNRASWQMVLNSRSQARLIAESATAMAAVNGSALAAADLVASSVAVAAAGASYVAQTVIGSSGLIFNALAANEPKYTAYLGGLVNFDAAAAQLYTVAGLLGNTTARTAIFANPSVVAVVGGSAVGRAALVSVHAAFTSIFDTAATLRALAPTACGAFNAQLNKAQTFAGAALTGSGVMGRWLETTTGGSAVTSTNTDVAALSVGQAKNRDTVAAPANGNLAMPGQGVAGSGFLPAANTGYTLWIAWSAAVTGNQRILGSYSYNTEGLGTDANSYLTTVRAGVTTGRGINYYLGPGWHLLRLRMRNSGEFYIKLDNNAESADLGTPPQMLGGLFINAAYFGGGIASNAYASSFGTILQLSNPGGASGAADAEIDRIQDLLAKQYLA